MNWLRTIAMRVRSLAGKRRTDHELDDELLAHFEMLVDQSIQSGMTPEDARRAARLALGGPDQIKEAVHDQRGFPLLDSVLADIRYAARILRKSPAFTIVAVLTLALGIGANTAIFSVLEAQIWRQLPFPQSDQLFYVGRTDAKHPNRSFMMSVADFQEWLPQAGSTFASACAFQGSDYHATPGAETAEMVTARPVSSGFFETLRMPPALGRAFLASEQEHGRDREAILSYAFWQKRYAANPNILGKAIVLDGSPYTIVGVAPKGLRFEVFGDPDMYVPLARESRNIEGRSGMGVFIVAREKPGEPIAAAQAEMDVIAQQLARRYPDEDGHRGIKLERLADAFGGPHQGLFFFAGAAGLVLLIACVNVASLLLARGLTRQHEFAIRSALGASRVALLRQLLVEGAMLGAMAGTVGLLAAIWGADALNALLPRDFMGRDVAPQLDGRVLAFAIAISIAAAVLSALFPGLLSSRVNLAGALQSGTRSVSGSSGQKRLRTAFVMSEVTIAVALLFGAGLFLNSFVRQVRAPLGFDPHNLISMGLTFSDQRYAAPENLWSAEQQIIARVRAVPGVANAGIGSQIPFAGGIYAAFTIVGRPAPRVDETPHALFSSVSSNYFQLLKIPMLAGRLFGSGDTQNSPSVAIVNQNFVDEYLGGRNAVGTELDIFDEATLNRRFRLRIVGVVQNTHMFGPNEVPFEFIYAPAAQVPVTSFNDSVFLLAATQVSPASVIDAIRHQIAEVDRGIPVTHIATMDERAAESLQEARANLILIGLFAAFAVVLVAVGIFGAVAYFVEQRTREFGIRLTLGALPSQILRHALNQSAMIAVSGLGLGIALSLALGRVLRSALSLVPGEHDGLLYGVSVFDPFTLTSACLLLAAVLLVASYIPARRAMRVDPIAALRYE